jgi:hypothetical protein
MLAEEVVVMEYKTPRTKTFTTISATGSAFIRAYVFKQLMKREAGRAGRQERQSAITPDNYAFETLGEERIGSTYCSVVHAIPKRTETYLFEGKIWIDDQDFAIVKVAAILPKARRLDQACRLFAAISEDRWVLASDKRAIDCKS